MSSKAKEWGVLAELCLVLAGIPLAVMAPQVLWQVFGEHQATGPLTLLAQFLATCVVLVVLMMVDTLVDAAFLALTGIDYETYMIGGSYLTFLLGPATVALADDPVLASHQVAALAPIATIDRQALLAAETVGVRLARLEAALADAVELLDLRLRADGASG